MYRTNVSRYRCIHNVLPSYRESSRRAPANRTRKISTFDELLRTYRTVIDFDELDVNPGNLDSCWNSVEKYPHNTTAARSHRTYGHTHTTSTAVSIISAAKCHAQTIASSPAPTLPEHHSLVPLPHIYLSLTSTPPAPPHRTSRKLHAR